MQYPIYRELNDGRSFYRIEAANRFTEVQIIGDRAIVHEVEALTYPEKVKMHDLLDRTAGPYVDSTAERFQAALDRSIRF